MHVMPHTGGRSPKQTNGPTSTSQLKAASDSGQNSGTSTRGRKRERVDHGAKRERSSRNDEGDSGQSKQESSLKCEIARITEKGGLAAVDGVESLVQLMQQDQMERKMDLVSRTMLVNVMASTDKVDCLNGFVQLRGLPILDEWLQDIHKGKIKDVDKSVEEFLLVLLRALDKLPINLHALQMCNIGRSVNHLRSHKNVEVHRKARTLVDTWKKRVEAEMKSSDSKAASWPSKSRIPEASKTPSGSDAMKSPTTQNSTSKSASLRSSHVSPGPVKALSSPASGNESQPKTSVGGASDVPPNREDRSSSSNQSHNSGSVTVNKISSSTPNLKISGFSGTQKETKSASAHKSAALEKLSHSALPSESAVEGPISDGNSHKLIVKIPNSVKSDDVSKDKSDTYQCNAASDMNTWQNNESKGADEEQSMMTEESKRTIEGFKSNRSKLENLRSSSFSPMNALIESCARYSEATSSLSLEDDVGINLLASVAAGEISQSNAVSPTNSSERSIPVIEALCNNDQTKSKSSPENCSACDGNKHAVSDGCSCSNHGLHLPEDEKINNSVSAVPICMENVRDVEPDKETHDEKTTSSNVISDNIPNCRSIEIHVMESKDGGGTDNLCSDECKDIPRDTVDISEFRQRDDNEKLSQTECGQKSMSEANDAVKAGVEPSSIHPPDEEDNDPDEKVMFDLNEDYNADDVKWGESTKASTTVDTNNSCPDASISKHERISLDFDLNVADERVIDELASRSIPARGSGFLDLDLNRLDETNDTSLYVQRDFDLNNGPVVEDDQISIKQVNGGIMSSAGIRTSSPGPGPGGFSSWFPPGSSFSTVAIPTIPSILPDRTEQPFPVFPPQRLYTSAGIAPFNPDVFRGSVLSSSPAMPYPSSSFQFPVVPFQTTYPLPSATFPVGATSYPVNSQFVGPMGSFSSQFQRPYMVSLPGISNNGGPDSYRNLSRPGLDLNAGPGAMESEVRDEMARHSMEQARMFSMPGRSILKRKEPEGSWENESFRNKQFSWQ